MARAIWKSRSSSRAVHRGPGGKYSAGGPLMPTPTEGVEARAGEGSGRLPENPAVTGAAPMTYESQRIAYAYFFFRHLALRPAGRVRLSQPRQVSRPRPADRRAHFATSKEIHTNLLLVWPITGFMGAAYFIVPEESRTEIWSTRLAYFSSLSGRDRRDHRRPLSLRRDGGAEAARDAASAQARRGRRHADVPGNSGDDDPQRPLHDDRRDPRRWASRRPRFFSFPR